MINSPIKDEHIITLLGEDRWYFGQYLCVMYTYMIIDDFIETSTFERIINNKINIKLWDNVHLVSPLVSFREIDMDRLLARSTNRLKTAILNRNEELEVF